ncbi:hypothetical protein N0V93_004018 [Gnomoniopsis smithogilvyi]|uniref:Uncharacterized protein n=1 Tax=Gnomoniopsis smithogilvyi TaxID=1191159 RepID=A0A9W9D0K5_9PEZI|nr:hypothetical protein N0V93_004018 [Gnomoniopsis smithogilvyi]
MDTSQKSHEERRPDKPVKRVRFDVADGEESGEASDHLQVVPELRRSRRRTTKTPQAFSPNITTLEEDDSLEAAVRQQSTPRFGRRKSSKKGKAREVTSDPKVDLPHTGFREPALLTYGDQDKQESQANHFLRDICLGPGFVPRFDKSQDQATILPGIEQCLVDIEEVYKFVCEENRRLSKSLKRETREDVRDKRVELRKQVAKKIRQLEKSKADFTRFKELADNGQFEQLPGWNMDDWAKHEGRQLQIKRTFGEFPKQGILYFKIDGSHEEPL